MLMGVEGMPPICGYLNLQISDPCIEGPTCIYKGKPLSSSKKTPRRHKCIQLILSNQTCSLLQAGSKQKQYSHIFQFTVLLLAQLQLFFPVTAPSDLVLFFQSTSYSLVQSILYKKTTAPSSSVSPNQGPGFKFCFSRIKILAISSKFFFLVFSDHDFDFFVQCIIGLQNPLPLGAGVASRNVWFNLKSPKACQRTSVKRGFLHEALSCQNYLQLLWGLCRALTVVRC